MLQNGGKLQSVEQEEEEHVLRVYEQTRHTSGR
jgi:hypothetical protein